MTTATHRPATRAPMTASDHVQQAIGEMDKARQSAQGEARGQLDRATDRLRTVASDLRNTVEEEAHEFQSSLDRASEHLRVDLGRRAIRAQTSTDALTELSSEIRKRKLELKK